MTPLSEVYNSFLQKITDFDILKLDEEDFFYECFQLLKSSVARFTVSNDICIVEQSSEFNRVLTSLEIDILSLGMVLAWVEPKINNIALYKMKLSSKDYKSFSQANHIKEMREIKSQAQKDFLYWSTIYSSKKALERLNKR